MTVIAVTLIGAHQPSAEIYRWVDEKGVTHFSDRKPVGTDKGKEKAIDPSKSGSVTVLDSGDSNASLFSYVKDMFNPVVKTEINKNASVIIYTTDW